MLYLRLLRETAHITQAGFARVAGVSVSTYAAIERGQLKPTARVATMMEMGFGMSIDALLSEVDVPVPPVTA